MHRLPLGRIVFDWITLSILPLPPLAPSELVLFVWERTERTESVQRCHLAHPWRLPRVLGSLSFVRIRRYKHLQPGQAIRQL